MKFLYSHQYYFSMCYCFYSDCRSRNCECNKIIFRWHHPTVATAHCTRKHIKLWQIKYNVESAREWGREREREREMQRNRMSKKRRSYLMIMFDYTSNFIGLSSRNIIIIIIVRCATMGYDFRWEFVWAREETKKWWCRGKICTRTPHIHVKI